MRKLRSFDEYLIESLKDPTEAALYLNACMDENDPVLLLDALRLVAKAHGMTRMSKQISLSRMGLHKALSKGGNPQLKTFLNILEASGIQLIFKPKDLKKAA